MAARVPKGREVVSPRARVTCHYDQMCQRGVLKLWGGYCSYGMSFLPSHSLHDKIVGDVYEHRK